MTEYTVIAKGHLKRDGNGAKFDADSDGPNLMAGIRKGCHCIFIDADKREITAETYDGQAWLCADGVVTQ
jgi:hypothetical protein